MSFIAKTSRNYVKTTEAVIGVAGKIGSLFAIALVLLITIEVFMRYVFIRPTNWNYETCLMVGGSLYFMGWSYALRERAHIRVDIFYLRLSPRGRAVIDFVGALLLFFPLIIAFTYASITGVWTSWATKELWILSYWYPPVYPFRALLALGFILLFFQGVALLIRDFYTLFRKQEL